METEEQKQTNPWISIWFTPRRTLRAILTSDPKRVIVWLAIISGLIGTISWIGTLWKVHPDNAAYRHVFFVLALLIFGGIMGLLHLYFGGWLYRVTGSWIGGRGTFTELKCAVGWSNYPWIVASCFSILGMLFSPTSAAEPTTSRAVVIFALLALIAFVWGVIIFFKLIAQAHRFSFWKAFGSVLIAYFLIFVVVMVIALLTPLLSPLFS